MRESYHRAARQACATGEPPIKDLGVAIAADKDFAAANADRAALCGAPTIVDLGGSQLTRWERQHIEILQAAASRDALRAEALLRDHTAEFGCDPIAVLAVATSLGSSADERLSDPRSASCSRPWTRSDFRSP